MSRAPMPSRWPRLIAALVLLTATAGTSASAMDELPTQDALRKNYQERIRPLLQRYCIDCHDQDTRSGLRLDTLAPDIAPTTIEAWTHVKNMLDVGSMPPKGKDRPTREEADRLLAWIGSSLGRYEADHRETGGDTLIRRINNRAWARMLETLLDTPAQGLDDFPQDGRVRGFDTVGAGLSTTTGLYECYWDSAQRTLDIAIPDSLAPPALIEQTRTFKWKNSGFETIRGMIARNIDGLRADPQRFEIQGISTFLGMVVVPEPLKQLVPTTVVVDTIVAACGEKSWQDVQKKKIEWKKDPKVIAALIAALETHSQRLGELEQYVSAFQPVSSVHPGYTQRVGLDVKRPGLYRVSARLCLLNPDCPLPVGLYANNRAVRSFTLSDPQSAPKTYDALVSCRAGANVFAVQAAFPTAIYTADHAWFHYFIDYLVARYRISEATAIELIGMHRNHNYLVLPKDYPGYPGPDVGPPTILCSEITARGPIYPSWPPPAVSRIFTRGVDAPPTRDYAEEIVAAFMKRAYATTDCDAALIGPYVDLIMSHYESGKAFIPAVKFGLASILCSPRFLYLDELRRAEPSRRQPLDAFALARRLAYFLWSDLPDEALLASASSGALVKDAELTTQTKRMLADPRSRAFREAFTTQWLKIDKLQDIAFSYDLLPTFSTVLLESAREESVAFFSELLDHNLSVMNFLDADFTMVDGCLAQHYGIPGVSGNEFRRVQLPSGSHRGGVLSQASVLMATSNGMVGSLVRRGAFIMERLLGVSPGRPPPNVQALDKTPTEKDGLPFTPRERMEQHRADQSCARCHDLIDPLGAGLENFDALGSYSDKIRVLLPKPDKKTHSQWAERDADAHGTLLDGTPFDGADGLKRQLLRKGDRFERCLAEDLALYALGRDLELSDRPVLDALCAKVAADDHGLASLVHGLVHSELFRCK